MGHQLMKIITSILLGLTFSSITAASLKCICNTCPDAETCETSPSRESTCFKSVRRLVHPENGTYFLEETYGCLSGGDGLLAPLQCDVNSLRHTEPLSMKCCKDQDFCNDQLPNPSEDEDPRWKISVPIGTSSETLTINNWTALAIGVFSLLSFCIIIKYIVTNLIRYCYGSRTKSQSSICTLKADLERFGQQAASSSVSTNSYSMSDDLYNKPPAQINDDSFIPEDLTSGIGGKLLSQRTIARAIGFGKTDHVGNGRFGRVFRGQFHGEDVAVKAFRTIDQESWVREDRIFRSLNHENIVRFIASEVTSLANETTEIWMFLEYCPLGSLCDYLDHHEVLGEDHAVRILYSIINGLNYLHEDYAQASKSYKPSIAHRDVKSKNILMKSYDSCCLADFGHALIKLDENTLDYGNQRLQVGTIRYMAPEILRPNLALLDYRNFKTFAQADLYQYGLILWEVCHRTSLDVLHQAGDHKLPYDDVVPQNPDMQDMIKIVCEMMYRPPISEDWKKYPKMKHLSDLMPECWRPNPKSRMETLGVKKKLKTLYDAVVLPQEHYFSSK